MSKSVLLIESDNGIAILTLNRPDSLNALNRELRETLVKTIYKLATDVETRVIILTGAGRAFCAGMDLKEAAEGKADDAAFTGKADLTGAMASFHGPIIGAMIFWFLLAITDNLLFQAVNSDTITFITTTQVTVSYM